MTPEDFNPDYLVPGTRIGGYLVRGLLGQGGSSSVYEVESSERNRFALKLCRYHGSVAYGTPERRVDQRLLRSIICLQLLKGRRNVAELYAHDRYPDPLHGHQYLVQELGPDSLAAGFRNLVVHAYEHLDMARIHAAAKTGPVDLRAFLAALIQIQTPRGS